MVVESTGVLIGFYLPCERTSLGPIITKPISKDIPTYLPTYPWTASPIEVPPVLKNLDRKSQTKQKHLGLFQRKMY